VQSAQQELLPHLAQHLALHVNQVNGQLQDQQPVQIVLLVALVLALLTNAQEHALLAIIQEAASVNALYVQQESLEPVEALLLTARALSRVPLASTRCLEQHPILFLMLMFAPYVQLVDMAQRAGLLLATVLALFLVLPVSLPYLVRPHQILRFLQFVLVAQEAPTLQRTRLNAHRALEDDMEPAELANAQALVLLVDLALALQINAQARVPQAPILQAVQKSAPCVLLERSASGWVSRRSLRLALESLRARQAHMHSLVFHLQTLRVKVFVLSVQLASTDQELDSLQAIAQAL